MSPPTRRGPRKLALVRPTPSWESALSALLGDRPDEAAALFAARALADPTDWPSRANHAIALYQADRWTQAAEAFTKLIGEIGPADLRALPMMFSVGLCLLRLDDPWGSLMATTGFLDYSNDRHPFYAAALENTACGWEMLGAVAEATTLRRAQELRASPDRGGPHKHVAKKLWRRSKVIATTYRILGFDAKPRPARRCSWPVGED